MGLMTHKTNDDFTAEEVATRWSCSVTTVYRKAKDFKVKRRRVLGRVLFDAADVERIAQTLANR